MKAIAKPASVKGQMDMFELLDKLTEGEEAIEPPGAAEAEIGDMIRDVAAVDLPLDWGDHVGCYGDSGVFGSKGGYRSV